MIDVELVIVLAGPAYNPVKEHVLRQFHHEYTSILLGMAGGTIIQAARIAAIDRSQFKRLMKKGGIEAKNARIMKPADDDAVDRWGPDDSGATYEVNIDNGFINAVQGLHNQASQDVISALSPEDARRLSAALLKAARMADAHPRWALAPRLVGQGPRGQEEGKEP